MSVPCPLEVIFAPIAVTTPLAASTVPVQSMATPWHPMGAAARVSCPNCNDSCRLMSVLIQVISVNVLKSHFSTFCLFAPPDIDECVTGTHTCSENQSCFNVQGGFRCLSFDCPSNYRRVGETWVFGLCLRFTHCCWIGNMRINRRPLIIQTSSYKTSRKWTLTEQGPCSS